ncbi:Rha family phage regulatory protein [Orbus hercynius]|uniref:Rha family phage regulatory protein n=1 Tax=Orbus hercynius TaxID=593135 RepID=A0A495RHV8_9GAMM|nr:Rha family transcriptional regulator [Orbus hercynius]RKS86890.1 Rha family phage regulatory protein [Orbus hercynius]
MTKLINMDSVLSNLSNNNLSMPDVIIVGIEPVTRSQAIATYFNKDHDKVVKRIENLDCSAQFLTRNFRQVKYNHRGNNYISYQVTKDGFIFLTMGFTGKKAATFKENYINQFNSMAEWIAERADAKDEQKNMTESLKGYINRTGDHQHGFAYGNECRYLNKLVLGSDPSKWAKLHSIDKKEIRNNMTAEQLALLTYLENRNCALLDLDTPTAERKFKLNKLSNRYLIKQLEKVA